MRRLIEQQAVIECLTNTAEYYDMPQADEWTKGIHYGLLHGIDNILDNVKPVEVIPKADYEARLKADMVAMLDKLRAEIMRKQKSIKFYGDFQSGKTYAYKEVLDMIDKYKAESEVEE